MTSPLKRTIVSFIANLFKSLLSFITGLLIARGLGPIEFGTFSFLIASFTALKAILDLGTSSAFFSFISKKNQSKAFYKNYFIWLFIQFSISILFIAFIAPSSWVETIWQGEIKGRIILAFVAVFMQEQIWGALNSVAESQRLTIRFQVFNAAVTIINLSIVMLIFFTKSLSIDLIFYLIIFQICSLVILVYFFIPINYTTKLKSLSETFLEYKVFCLPLIPHVILGVLMQFADTWFLQLFGGSIEQSYYMIGYRFSAISIILNKSVISILWKEVAEANENKNFKAILKFYNKSSLYLYLFSSLISCFLIPWSSTIISIFLGSKFIEGHTVLAIMLFYPVHQALGQINGAVYMALEQTKKYSQISIVFMLISILTTYVLLAPKTFTIPGFGLGSNGLALKMVLIQFVNTNYLIWRLSKLYRWKILFSYQYSILGSSLFIAYVSKIISGQLLQFFNNYVALLTSLLIYIIFVFLILKYLPWIFKVENSDKEKFFSLITSNFQRK